MNTLTESSAGQCEPCREEKYMSLMSVYHQIGDVLNRLDNFNERLGVYGEVLAGGEKLKESSKDPNNLIQVIDKLPQMAGDKLSNIHDLISQLESRLI
jgi:hypothetical protein